MSNTLVRIAFPAKARTGQFERKELSPSFTMSVNRDELAFLQRLQGVSRVSASVGESLLVVQEIGR